MFKKIFFPSPLKAKINDVQKNFYPNSMQNRLIIDENKIKNVIKKTKLNKASKSDEILNKILKIMTDVLFKKFILIFQICVNLTYHSRAFRGAHTITLKKINKENYITSKIYRFIILLNIIKKILKSIITQRLINITEIHNLLSHN